MERDELRALQDPLKEQYRADPTGARITLSAVGKLGEGISCSVATGRALADAGLHPLPGPRRRVVPTAVPRRGSEAGGQPPYEPRSPEATAMKAEPRLEAVIPDDEAFHAERRAEREEERPVLDEPHVADAADVDAVRVVGARVHEVTQV